MKAYDEHDRRGSGRSGRSRSRDRDRIRRDRDRHRSRSISREGEEIGGNRGAGKKGGERRARSVSRKEKLAAGDIDTPMLGTGDDEADEEAQMAAMMGFSGFGTTKQKKVQGNNVGAVAKHKTTEYRQYMYVIFPI
jgi:U4/U6.U5 tri-snRNP-associated protein 3